MHELEALKLGADGGIRTRSVSNVADFKSAAFHQFRHIRIIKHYIKLNVTCQVVPPSGIEPDSTALQTVAMTTSAKAANWCFVTESNCRNRLVRAVFYH